MRHWQDEISRLEGAYAPSTIRAYRTDLQAYEIWCHAENHIAFPASQTTLCHFIEDEGSRVVPGTLKRRLYAIRKAHRLLGYPDPTDTEDIALALRRTARSNPRRPSQAKGLTDQFLHAFLEIQPDTLVGLRNCAMMSLGYDVLSRRSELVALRDADLESCANGTYRVLIRRSKTDPCGSGRLAFCSRRTAILLEKWWARRGDMTDYLFCPIYNNVPIDRALSGRTVARVIRAAATSVCDRDTAPDFKGHSLRVGGAQDLLKRGLDTAGIMRAGGWKSVHVLARYLEQADHNPWV